MVPTTSERFPDGWVVSTTVNGRRVRVFGPIRRTFDLPDVDFIVEMRIEPNDDELLEVVDYRVRRRPGGPGVTSNALRRVPFDALRRAAIEQASSTIADDGTPYGWGWQEPLSDGAHEALTRPRRGPAPVSDERLSVAADLYRQRGDRRDYLKWMKQELEARGEHVSKATILNWIREAERRGL